MRRRAAPSRLSSSSPHTAAKIRDRPPTHGLSRAGWRACGPGSTCGSRSVSSTRPTWSTCSTAVEEQLWSPRCCWPMPTMLASTSLPRSPAAALVTGYARPVCWVRTFGWCQRCMSASPSWGFRRSTTHWGGRARDRLIASRGQCAHLDGGVKAGGGDPVGRGDDRFHHPTGGFAGRCHRSVATPRCPSDGHRAMAARPWDTV